MEAIRCLKRRISDAVYRQLLADARTAEGHPDGSGRALRVSTIHNPHTSTLRMPLCTREPDATTVHTHQETSPTLSRRVDTEGSRYDAGTVS